MYAKPVRIWCEKWNLGYVIFPVWSLIMAKLCGIAWTPVKGVRDETEFQSHFALTVQLQAVDNNTPVNVYAVCIEMCSCSNYRHRPGQTNQMLMFMFVLIYDLAYCHNFFHYFSKPCSALIESLYRLICLSARIYVYLF